MHKQVSVQINGSTSNLGAGFDTLGLCLELPLQVKWTVGATPNTISASGEGATEISQAKNNLILRAFHAAFHDAGVRPPAVQLEIHNRIPLRRGLGSSGAAVAAGLLAANALLENRLNSNAILRLANQLEGHPENASASLLGGMTVCSVHDSKVLCRTINAPDWRAVCFVPDLEIATAEARRILPEVIKRAEAGANVQAVAMMVLAFTLGEASLLRAGTNDFLHQPYRRQLIAGYEQLENAALAAGAHCFFISGSGSTTLALCDPAAAERVAAAAKKTALAMNVKGRAMVLRLSNESAAVNLG